MPWFVLHPSGHRYPVGPSGLSLGRAADNDVVLADDEVSRNHALIQLQGEQAWLYDRSSFNGVYVNEERISAPYLLRPGDSIRLGRTRLQTEYMPAATPSRPINAALPTSVDSTPGAVGAPAAPAGKSWANNQFWQAAALGALIGLVGIVIVFLLVVRPLLNASQTPTPAPDPNAVYTQAVNATALLLAPIGDTSNSIASTGVVLTEKGRLLTAYGAVYDPLTERPYNSRSQVLVGLSSNPRQAAGTLDHWYLARVVRADRLRDLAVLQIFSQQDGSPLPNSFSWPQAPMGNAAAIRPGDGVAVVSYSGTTPSGSNQVLALGRGQVTGILPDTAMGLDRGWLQTDIGLGRGNLGALAVDGSGRLIGMYTGKPEDAGSTAGLLRPLDVATPLLFGSD